MPALYTFYDWLDRIKRYYLFSRSEQVWIGTSILVMAFIVGFRFEGESFALNTFLGNMALGLAAVGIAVFFHESAHRVFGLNMGYKTEFKPALYGLVAGVILAFMTYGKVIFLAYSGVALNIMEKHRLGYFRYQLGYFDLGKVSLAGVLANLLVAAAVKSMGFLPQPLAEKIILVNVIFAITNVLPLPPLDGANIMFASKTFYPVVLGAVISCGLLLLVPWLSVWLAIATSLVIGIVTAYAYFSYVEPKLGR
ncbi:TPA: hypothetical protein HA231_01910 [Candidatus Woesearchaeota archaeon]|nr:hypothetical protein [Candidatus Woesearchaeota archaeon]